MKNFFFLICLALSAPSFADDSGNDLYTKKDATFEAAFSAFRDAVADAPIISAGVNYLSISAAGGSCPHWTISPPLIQVSIDLGRFFCTDVVSGALSVVGWGMLVAALYFAFGVAFL